MDVNFIYVLRYKQHSRLSNYA